jgi:hypothetical protein
VKVDVLRRPRSCAYGKPVLKPAPPLDFLSGILILPTEFSQVDEAPWVAPVLEPGRRSRKKLFPSLDGKHNLFDSALISVIPILVPLAHGFKNPRHPISNTLVE